MIEGARWRRWIFFHVPVSAFIAVASNDENTSDHEGFTTIR
jgi:hypothetical protein